MRLALAVALVLAGAPAFAKPQVGTRRPGERPSADYASPQWFALEFKFSPYTPAIDSSSGLNGQTPFKDLFTAQGEATRPGPGPRLLTQIEFDFQFLHKVGSLGVGLSIGYYRRTTHSFQYADETGSTQCTVNVNCVRSGDENALNIIPLSAMAIYRFDWLALKYKVPLVPYFKIGLAYYIWVIQSGSGGVAKYTDPITGRVDEGAGGTWGWVLNPGISFLLDIIDPSAARVIDAELGINHTYLFVELHHADISGFGRANQMNLSDTTLNAGLAFEF